MFIFNSFEGKWFYEEKIERRKNFTELLQKAFYEVLSLLVQLVNVYFSNRIGVKLSPPNSLLKYFLLLYHQELYQHPWLLVQFCPFIVEHIKNDKMFLLTSMTFLE